jgi:hypothetical protein
MGSIRSMEITSGDYEKLGQFYLGRGYDPDTRAVDDDLILYDSKDLVTHGVVLGMTGSGKTGLCLALLEEAAMDNIPAIVIDPKGDISNLLLTFPELDAKSFRPWINEDDAAKKAVSPDEFAAKTAETWKKGLADWGQDPSRIATLKEKVDINIFTPGSKAGIPVSILSSLEVPPFEVMDDGELLGERVESTVSSLLSLVGVAGDAIQSPEAVLCAAIFQKAWADGQNVTLESLIRSIQKPSFDKVGVIDLESFMPEKTRQSLALKFNNLLASPGFASWLEGPPLDIAKMLHTPDGKPRISIFSIAHLGDTERMFFVSLLLNQMLGWMRAQNGTTSLRALLYMDEIYGFLPPTANPPSKRPMMTLLKQGRAFGLGCLLATQNPVDLDYKALSNIGTWFLGRLQTERDKARVLDGLEGAAGSQNAKFDRKDMERMLSGLSNRVFLMNNVHEDHPVLFHVRWVMSYLTGPLTRSQIKTLMDPKRGAFGAGKTEKSAAGNPMGMPGMNGGLARPHVGPGVVEKFAKIVGDPLGVIYRPYLLLEGSVYLSQLYGARGKGHQVHARIATAKYMHSSPEGELENRPYRVVHIHSIDSDGFDLENELNLTVDPSGLVTDAEPGLLFQELPGAVMNVSVYKTAKKYFAEWIYRNYYETVSFSPLLEQYSMPKEVEREFRVRISHSAREARDAAIEGIRGKAEKRIVTFESRMRTAEGRLAKEKAEANSANVQAGVSLLGGILGAIFGRKSGRGSLSRGNASIGKATGAYKQHQDVAAADAKVGGFVDEIASIRSDLEAEISQISATFDPAELVLNQETFKPTRSDIEVEMPTLLWLPYDDRGDPAWGTSSRPQN